jgi:recombination protein RecT
MASTATAEQKKVTELVKAGDKDQAVQKSEPTMSERFTNAVVREFGSIAKNIQLTPYQKRLAQHLFLKIDASLNEAESKRTDKSKPAIAWANINMTKLATDAMHRVDLGLDALIPATIYPIAYLNSRTQKYDLDLRIGYKGEDFYRRAMAIDPPVDVRYELVYEKDKFRPIKKRIGCDIESYEFEVADTPFDRGEVVGGFGYIEYTDPKRNQLILVTDKDFKKSEAKAGSDKFWKPYRDEMKYKTLVHRTTDKIPIDPQKVSSSFLAVQQESDYIDAEVVSSHIKEVANTGPVIEIEHTEPGTVTISEGAPEPQSVKCPARNGDEMFVSYCQGTCKERAGCPEFGDDAGEVKASQPNKKGPKF